MFATLRDKGHLSSAFLDDSVLVAQSRESCLQNVRDTVQLLRSLGFIIHPEKSVLEPSHTIQYLGVVINCVTMKVKLTSESRQTFARWVKTMLEKTGVSVEYSPHSALAASVSAVYYLEGSQLV